MKSKQIEYLLLNIYLTIAIAFTPFGIIAVYLTFIKNINVSIDFSLSSALILSVIGWLNVYMGFKSILKIRECYNIKESDKETL